MPYFSGRYLELEDFFEEFHWEDNPWDEQYEGWSPLSDTVKENAEELQYILKCYLDDEYPLTSFLSSVFPYIVENEKRSVWYHVNSCLLTEILRKLKEDGIYTDLNYDANVWNERDRMRIVRMLGLLCLIYLTSSSDLVEVFLKDYAALISRIEQDKTKETLLSLAQ